MGEVQKGVTISQVSSQIKTCNWSNADIVNGTLDRLLLISMRKYVLRFFSKKERLLTQLHKEVQKRCSKISFKVKETLKKHHRKQNLQQKKNKQLEVCQNGKHKVYSSEQA